MISAPGKTGKSTVNWHEAVEECSKAISGVGKGQETAGTVTRKTKGLTPLWAKWRAI
jgi:hypothetical protein